MQELDHEQYAIAERELGLEIMQTLKAALAVRLATPRRLTFNGRPMDTVATQVV